MVLSKLVRIKFKSTSDIEKETKRMCEFIGINYDQEMCDFPSRMRNPDKRKRYSSVDKSQIAVWKEWKTAYSGFFSENDYNIETLFEYFQPLVEEFGYE